MKKLFAIILCVAMLAMAFTACSSGNDDTPATDDAGTVTDAGNDGGEAATGMTGAINVISREEGSGTRSAFTELLGIVDENENDATIATAEATNSTAVMMQTVADNEYAIGYISLGSLSDTVKAVSVDGVAATAENVANGTYPIARPFNVAVKEGLSDVAADFLTFLTSAEGQQIIEDEGYIKAVTDAPAYTGSGMSGTVSLAGSTSVGPVMEVLAEAYMEINPDVSVEVQQSGSGAGMTSAIEGVCDIGMASRDVSEEEQAQGLIPTTIATDGIAVIVNLENPVDNMASEDIRDIYLGTITDWSEIQ